MKKLFLAILILLNSVSLSFGAIAATTVWEVRTTGDATNGGGFNPAQTDAGTDYSQQDAAQLSSTDLAMATGGTTLTSSTGGFTAAMIGNIIYIASGTHFTAGYYEITDYTDTNTVTLDRDATDGTNGSSGAGKVGGALSSPASAVLTSVSYNTIWVKSGTYTEKINATNRSSIYLFGYQSARGDYPYGDNRVIINATGNTNAIYASTSDAVNWIIKNVIFKNASESGIYRVHGTFVNCRTTNNGGKGHEKYNQYSNFINFECDNNGSVCHGGNWAGGSLFINSYIHDNSSSGISVDWNNGSSYTIFDSIFDSNSGNGISVPRGGCVSVRNLIYNNTGTGIYTGSFTANGNTSEYLFNNAIVSNGGYGIYWNDTRNPSFFDFNAYYNNTSGNLLNVTAGAHDVTSDPSFTDAAGGDFTLSSSSSPLIGAGLDLSTFTSLTTDFNVNIGIDQGDHASGGGNVIIIEGD